MSDGTMGLAKVGDALSARPAASRTGVICPQAVARGAVRRVILRLTDSCVMWHPLLCGGFALTVSGPECFGMTRRL